MSNLEIGVWSLVALVMLVYSGLHVAITLALVSFVAITLMRNADYAGNLLALATEESISSYCSAWCPCSC